MDFRVFSDDLSKIPLRGSNFCRNISTISPNSYGITTIDSELKNALQKSDFLVLDGVYFALASILHNGKNIKKNQGPEVFYHFMERLNISCGRVFFFGSTTDTLKLIKDKTNSLYPNVCVSTFSPPYKDKFSKEENLIFVKKINNFNPDVVFVGMTCPKQEKWAHVVKSSLNASLIISIGNVFDWYAGTQKAISPIWFKLRLAWLIRIFNRPEIFKRNINNQIIFFRDTLQIFFKIKKI